MAGAAVHDDARGKLGTGWTPPPASLRRPRGRLRRRYRGPVEPLRRHERVNSTFSLVCSTPGRVGATSFPDSPRLAAPGLPFRENSGKAQVSELGSPSSPVGGPASSRALPPRRVSDFTMEEAVQLAVVQAALNTCLLAGRSCKWPFRAARSPRSAATVLTSVELATGVQRLHQLHRRDDRLAGARAVAGEEDEPAVVDFAFEALRPQRRTAAHP